MEDLLLEYNKKQQYVESDEPREISEGLIHELSEKDLELSNYLVKEILKKKRYDFPSGELYSKKIKELFGIDINQTDDKYIKLNRNDFYQKGEKITFDWDVDGGINNFYIVKEERLLTELYFIASLWKNSKYYSNKEVVNLTELAKDDFSSTIKENTEKIVAFNQYFWLYVKYSG